MKIQFPFITRKWHEDQMVQLKQEKGEAEKYLLKIIEQHTQIISYHSFDGRDEPFDLNLEICIDPIFLDYAIRSGNPINEEQRQKFIKYIICQFADWLESKLTKMDFAMIESREKIRSKLLIRYIE